MTIPDTSPENHPTSEFIQISLALIYGATWHDVIAETTTSLCMMERYSKAETIRREKPDTGGLIIFIFFIILGILALVFKIWDYFAARKVGPITTTPTIVFPCHQFTFKMSNEGVRFLCGYTAYNKKKKWNEAELTEKLESLLKIAGYSFVYKDARVIMIKMNGFRYGTQCHEFVPDGGAAPGSHFTYQVYGNKRIQVTNYVEDGVSYLAGFCIYITYWRTEKSTYRRDFIHKIMRAAMSKNGNPAEQVKEQNWLGNSPSLFEQRAESENSIGNETSTMLENGEHSGQKAQQIFTEDFLTTDWNVKYCETLQREVMTKTSDDTVFHKEWNNMLELTYNVTVPKEMKTGIAKMDPIFELFIFTLFMLYVIILLLLKLWDCATRKKNAITTVPTIVFPRHKFTVHESHEGIRFLCGYTRYNTKQQPNTPELTEKLESLLRLVGRTFVYREARVIMVRMNGFRYGAQCHDFVPEGGAAPGSHYTYQMYGYNQIQATNYVEDGVSYLAGFCIYIEDWNMSPYTYEQRFVYKIMKDAKSKNGNRAEHVTERNWIRNSPAGNSSGNLTSTRLENGEHSGQKAQPIFTEDFLTTNWNVKYCETLQREVMTKTSDDTVFHKEWNNTLGAMKIHKCARCFKTDQPPAYSTLFIE
ncbi:unnamed protein product [Caenorhabditis brenneri]